jgi:hypothetical protein
MGALFKARLLKARARVETWLMIVHQWLYGFNGY